MRAAKRLLKGARVRYPGVLQEWGPYKGGIWKLGFPGVSQLTTRAYWENALDTAGVGVEEYSNPKMNPSRLPRPSLIGTIADAYFPFDAMEQTVKGAVEDVRRLGNPDTSPIEQWPIWRYVLAPLGAYVTDWRAASTRSDYSTLHLNGRSVTLRGSDHWNFNNPTTSRTAREASTLRYTAPGFERAVALWAGYTESQLKGLNLKTQRDLKILGSRSPENAV